MVNIVVLTGGVGGAKFLLGVKAALGWDPFGDPPANCKDQLSAVVNTGDDIRLHGLMICPDLDSCMYTLSGSADAQRGWGQSAETWNVSSELRLYDAEAPWFSLGDKDIATHLMRTQLLAAGKSLTEVTAILAKRRGTGVRLLPMSDAPVTTMVDLDLQPGAINHDGDDPAHQLGSPSSPAGTPSRRVNSSSRPAGSPSSLAGSPSHAGSSIHFQEWWVRYRAEIPPRAFRFDGVDASSPAPGVLEAIETADLILIAPSNPVVSIGPIVSVPGISSAIAAAGAPVIGVSPIIGGKPVRGFADSCLAAIGVECSAEGVGKHYGAREMGGLLDGFLVAPGDAFELPGLRVIEAPLLMSTPAATADMVRTCMNLADALRGATEIERK